MTKTPREDAAPDAAGAPRAPEPAVDSVAVELSAEAVPPPTPVRQPVVPLTILQSPAPVAAPEPAMNPIVDVSGAPSSTAPSFDGHAAEPPMNPLGELAAERPEVLVGAAFAGGILIAMILRRLGS